MENLETEIFNLIVHNGNARALIFEAFERSEQQKYDIADQLMNEANEELILAHNVQTKLIQEELQQKTDISLLLFMCKINS